jgi:hypothetical protein
MEKMINEEAETLEKYFARVPSCLSEDKRGFSPNGKSVYLLLTC